MEHDIKVAIFTLINEINKKGKALLQQLEVRDSSWIFFWVENAVSCSCGCNWVVVYVHIALSISVHCSFSEQYDCSKYENDFESYPHYTANVLIRLIQLLQILSGVWIKWFSNVYIMFPRCTSRLRPVKSSSAFIILELLTLQPYEAVHSVHRKEPRAHSTNVPNFSSVGLLHFFVCEEDKAPIGLLLSYAMQPHLWCDWVIWYQTLVSPSWNKIVTSRAEAF